MSNYPPYLVYGDVHVNIARYVLGIDPISRRREGQIQLQNLLLVNYQRTLPNSTSPEGIQENTFSKVLSFVKRAYSTQSSA